MTPITVSDAILERALQDRRKALEERDQAIATILSIEAEAVEKYLSSPEFVERLSEALLGFDITDYRTEPNGQHLLPRLAAVAIAKAMKQEKINDQ